MFRCELRTTNASFRETAGGPGGFARECTESRNFVRVPSRTYVLKQSHGRGIVRISRSEVAEGKYGSNISNITGLSR